MWTIWYDINLAVLSGRERGTGENPGDFLCRVSLLFNTVVMGRACLPAPNISHRKVGETGKSRSRKICSRCWRAA